MTCTKAPKIQAKKLLKSKQYFEFLALFRAFFGAIAKHCPLKQGLRLFEDIISVYVTIYCKTLSTKTRIAT